MAASVHVRAAEASVLLGILDGAADRLQSSVGLCVTDNEYNGDSLWPGTDLGSLPSGYDDSASSIIVWGSEEDAAIVEAPWGPAFAFTQSDYRGQPAELWPGRYDSCGLASVGSLSVPPGWTVTVKAFLVTRTRDPSRPIPRTSSHSPAPTDVTPREPAAGRGPRRNSQDGRLDSPRKRAPGAWRKPVSIGFQVRGSGEPLSTSVFQVRGPGESLSTSVFQVRGPGESLSTSVFQVRGPGEPLSTSVFQVRGPGESLSTSVFQVRGPGVSLSASVFEVPGHPRSMKMAFAEPVADPAELVRPAIADARQTMADLAVSLSSIEREGPPSLIIPAWARAARIVDAVHGRPP